MTSRIYIFLLLGFLAATGGYGQEALTGLYVNPVVRAKALAQRPAMAASEGLDTIPVGLPFFDDFSANGIFPSSQRWIDRYAFENDDFPVYPVNIGAMTLDAINDSGKMYPNAVAGPVGFIADHLTSRYIRLDSVFTPAPRALTPSDSVYLSFYYQPQGRGQRPQKNDTLILEFLVRPAYDSIVPNDTVYRIPDQWRKMWYANGMTLDSFLLKHNRYFARVMVPVTDTSFLKKNFRFRFYNYASLASSAEPSWQSNTDHWNLDHVYLNLGRNMFDTVYPELRFIYRPPSMLRKYASMPYPQYCNDPTNEARDTLDIVISNRDIVSHTANYGFSVTDPAGSFAKSYNGGQYEIDPSTLQVPYVTYQKFAHPAVPFLMPVSSTDSATFLVRHVVRDVAAGSTIGDTMEAYQKFYNYYAYDDGTPEASYGLSFAGSRLAYRFKLNQSPDTLRAVNMFFSQTLSGTSQQWFYLCVWNDNAGKPGDTIYSELVMPRYADSLNQFVTYHLKRKVAITGTFYVGWIQTTFDNLSIGFDRYNNSQPEIFFNTVGTWTNTAFTGSLLIRPVIGKPIPLGVNNLPGGGMKLTLYPNPCSGGTLHLRLPVSADPAAMNGSATITITDLVGRSVMRTAFSRDIDVSMLPGGIYFLTLRDQSGRRLGVAKFIRSR